MLSFICVLICFFAETFRLFEKQGRSVLISWGKTKKILWHSRRREYKETELML